jgi:hypothetical protein
MLPYSCVTLERDRLKTLLGMGLIYKGGGACADITAVKSTC